MPRNIHGSRLQSRNTRVGVVEINAVPVCRSGIPKGKTDLLDSSWTIPYVIV